GDVLFQVHFLSLLMEERGAGDLAAVAEHCRQKLIRRHPHVYGEVAAQTAGEVLRNWDEIKRGEAGRESGIFGEVPENLPGPLYARKVIRRARSAGIEPEEGDLHALADAANDFDSVGDLLFACVALARRLHVDPELALRAAADRFRAAHE
ncbi:MAG TPA: MazG nucleotide pyrophosphohydrolase domain-containing protein, partial [Solirubrobacteraceae bacterium]|nr:MazG nucleotide pyrophosphohydrolase domain-containing protein [Solirubrobacteraceae bacterium]